MFTRIYRLLLSLCPSSFVTEYGKAMEEMFATRLAGARSLLSRARVVVREYASVIAVAMTEQRSNRHQRNRSEHGKGVGGMEQMMRELRHAARRLARSPGFTVAAVSTLALAIGANAAIFTVVHRVVLNPLPYAESDRVVALDHGAPGWGAVSGLGMTSGLYFQYVERARTLESVALYWTSDLTLTGVGEPERVRVAWATPSLARVLRVSPELGRWFTEEEGAPGGDLTVVLAHSFWTDRFSRDARILGGTVTLSGASYTVVGVMPPEFAFPDPGVHLWRAAVLNPATARAAGFNFDGIARLRGGASLEEARSELNSIIPDLANAYPEDPYGPAIVDELRLTSTLLTLKARTVGRVAESLWILLASVGLVLLVACANVANLFLVRSESRQKEIAVREALGAGRGGVRRFFFTESLLLSMLGAVAGIAIASAGVRLLVAFGPESLPRLEEVRLDGIVILYALALGTLAALIFGWFPLARRTSFSPALQESGRGNTASRSRHRARHLLMGVQMALACVLLIGAGLMVRSFQSLRAVDPHFDAESALTFRIGLPSAEYETRDAAVLVHSRILEQLAMLPAVRSVSASTCLPLDEGGFCNGDPIFVDGRASQLGTAPPVVAFRAVAGDWFETIGTRIVRGRGIERADIQRNDPVIVINEALAEVYFPGEDPIGRRIALPGPDGIDPLQFTIVGIARNTPTFSLAETAATPKAYMGWQSRTDAGPGLGRMDFVLRTANQPLELLPRIRAAVANVDPNLAISQVRTLEDVLVRSSAQAAFLMALIVIAAAVALLLGLIGIYGVISYIVSQRAGEIGVRLALGAEPGRVAGLIVRQGIVVAAAGLAFGLLAALAISGSVRTILFGVSPTDPFIYAIVSFSLLAVALIACWLPARRAARLSPVEALRVE